MLVPMSDILIDARKNNYGVMAPIASTIEEMKVLLDICEEYRAPIIILAGNGYCNDDAWNFRYRLEMARQCKIPVSICLDHGKDYEQAISAIHMGLPSVMADFSKLSFEENIQKTAEIVKVAHSVNVAVEAELGHVGQGTNYAVDGVSCLTEPSKAKEFVERTQVDCLAVAIGTAHGPYKGTPKLHFDLLDEIAKEVSIPLAVHGGSGSGDDNLAKATKHGICKVNVATDLLMAKIDAIKNSEIENGKPYTSKNLQKIMNDAYRKVVIHYLQLFDQCNRA